jgi:hypothetical protein
MQRVPKARWAGELKVRRIRRITCALLVTFSLVGPTGADTFKLNLTTPRTAAEQTSRYPGASVGSYPAPKRYSLPLSIVGTVIREDTDPAYALIDLTVTNSGAHVFELPTSLDARRVEADGNRGRRVFQFEVETGSEHAQQDNVVIQTTDASSSIPSSYMELQPRDQVTITMRLRKTNLGLKAATEQTLFMSIVEATLDDSAFVVSSSSEPIVSPPLNCRTDPDWPRSSLACR